MAKPCQVVCTGCSGRSSADDDDLSDDLSSAGRRIGHTLRMSASFSPRCFSSWAMYLSVSFCTFSCSSRL